MTFFTQGLWGELQQRTSSTPLMGYLKDSFDTGHTRDGFLNPKSIKGYRSSYSLPDPVTMKVAKIYLLIGILGRNLCNLHSYGTKAQVSSLPKQRGVTEISQQTGFIPIPNGPKSNL